MEIFILGAGHWQTPVAMREKLAQVSLSGSSLYPFVLSGVLSEVLVLSTCNRLEIAGVAPDPLEARRLFLLDLAQKAGLEPEELEKYFHFHRQLAAVRYLFRVASGLESQVLGEPQILGQVKDAFREGLKMRTVGPVVGKLFHKSFRTAKRARTETGLALGSVSVASAAAETARSFPGGLAGRRVLIAGAGEMAALAQAHLQGTGLASVTIISRTYERARELAARAGSQARAWTELESALGESDLILAAAGAREPIITLEMLRKISRPDPQWFLDLGVPRNVEEAAGRLPGVTLRNIDEISALAEANQKMRLGEVAAVEAIIEEETVKFGQWLESLATRPTILALTRLAEEARRTEVDKTLLKNSFSEEQARAVTAMSRALVRRILHNPLTFAKSCHRHGRSDFYLDLVRRVFGVDQ